MNEEFSVKRADPHGAAREGAHLLISGRLDFRDSARLKRAIRGLLKPEESTIRFDLSNLQALDGGSTAVLLALQQELQAAGKNAEVIGAEDRVRALLELYQNHGACAPTSPHSAPHRVPIFEQIGRTSLEIRDALQSWFAYVGDVLAQALIAIRLPATVHWRDVGRMMERAGADGLPIVALINFLVGLVMGFQAAVQLKQIGANLFVADLVALAQTRELGPLMTAIVVAGRSGAAFAAEIGTMQVSEEVDALHTLRLNPYRFLVFPRTLALIIVVPLLTLVADFVGILGGLVVGVTGLDLSVNAYLIETRLSLDAWDVFSGVLKSVFFAGAIALIACQRGLATRGGAEGVGRSTTSAVVAILFAIIVIDAVFTVLYHVFDI